MSGLSSAKIARFFVGRAPEKQAVLGVYAVVVFIVYSWTLAASFYKLPSWVFFLTAGKIISIYAYDFSVNLVESFCALLGLLFLDFTLFLPLRNKDEFQARQILTAFILLASAAGRLYYYGGDVFIIRESTWWLITLVIGLPVVIFVPRIQQVRNILDAFAERTLVFLFIYLPISFLSVIIVIIRNVS